MYQPQNAPSIQLEGDHLIVRLDHGGLVIIRKEPDDNGECSALSLPPDEASEFTMLLMMSQHAIAPLVQTVHQVIPFQFEKFEEDEEDGS